MLAVIDAPFRFVTLIDKCLLTMIACSITVVGASSPARADSFPPIGCDMQNSEGVFKVVFLNGSSVIGPVVSGPMVVGRSDPFATASAPLLSPIGCSGGFPHVCPDAPQICNVPFGAPMSLAARRMVRTEILQMTLSGVAAVRVGEDYWNSSGIDPDARAAFYRCSFGEVDSFDNSGIPANDFPAYSYFEIFAEVQVGGFRLYNLSPMVVASTISGFPPFSLPNSDPYSHAAVKFPATTLYNARGLQVAYLMTANHGATGGVTNQPSSIDAARFITPAAPLLFCVDSASTGLAPGIGIPTPNHVRADQAAPVQQVTVYRSSGANDNAGPDHTNARVNALVGAIGIPSPPQFANGDTINAISLGRDGTRAAGAPFSPQPGILYLSVSRTSFGKPCTGVYYCATAGTPPGSQPRQAAPIFVAQCDPFGVYAGPGQRPLSIGRNHIAVDGTALGLRPSLPYSGQDNLTGLEISRFEESDRLYCAISGPSATGLGAAIMKYEQPSGPFDRDHLVVFAPATASGLGESDQIDGMVLSDFGNSGPNGILDPNFDEMLFSLAPGSPSLAGFSAADVFYTGFDGSFSLFASADDLGLLETDDIDAMDIAPLRIPGDCNNDGSFSIPSDLPVLVDVLLCTDHDSDHISNCDLNSDGYANGLDVSSFVELAFGA